MTKLYVVRSQDGHYKIGVSRDPESRLQGLNVASPYELEIVETFDVDAARHRERVIHDRLSDSNTNGEWFDSEDVMDVVFDVVEMPEGELPGQNGGIDWRTIRIPETDFEHHNEQRKNLGATWADYIDGQAPEYTYTTETQTVSPAELREIVREEVRDALREVAR